MKDKKKKRITTITHYGALYGANRSLLTLILASKDVIDWLVICQAGGDFTQELTKNNIQFKIIPFGVDIHIKGADRGKRRIRSILKFAKNLFIIPYILLVAKTYQTHAIHSNSSVFTLGALLAFFGRMPHLWHIREFPALHYNYFYDFGQNWFRFWANKAERIICVSHYLQQQCIIKNDIHARSFVLYNGIESDGLLNSEVTSSRFQVVMVGVIHPAKEQLTAIRAVEILVKAGMTIHLRIVGAYNQDDPYYQSLKSYIKTNKLFDHIELTGYFTNVDDIYKGAHISVMCSRSEGMGRVTVESMLRAVPVIAYNEGGSTEIITHNEDGILYTGNHEDLAAEIKSLATDVQNLKSFARRARINAKAKFNVAQYRDKFLEIVGDIPPPSIL